MVLKQDKGRGGVVLARKKYTEKCIYFLHTDSIVQLDHDPTKADFLKFKGLCVKSRQT